MHSHSTTKYLHIQTQMTYFNTLSNLYKSAMLLQMFVNKNTIIVGTAVANTAWVISMWKFYFIENG